MTDSTPLNPDPSPEDDRLAERLAAQRPVPGAGFRGALGRRLVGLDPGYGPRPARLWRLVSLWLAAGLVVLAIGAVTARAATRPVAPLGLGKLPGPTSFITGLTDDQTFQFSSPAIRNRWLGRAQSIGSSEVRINATWASVAPATLPKRFNASNPADPGYDWTELDAVVRAAAAHRQSVLLQLYDAPRWAEAPDPPSYAEPGSWEPNARAYGAFAHAAALRYSGRFPDPLHRGRRLPRVTDFQAWNEPNLPGYLLPQWVTGTGTSIVAASPGIYRGLLNAFYAGIKSAVHGDYVVAAGTAPYGDPPGVDRMKPLTFLRGLLCLTARDGPARCPNPVHFDALSHHPYAINPTVHARIPGDVSVSDLGQIWTLIHAAQRHRRALPAGPKSLWVTELDWSTQTDIPNPITLPQQARYVSLAFYELWTQDVSHVIWFDLRDPTFPEHSNDDTGLYLLTGTAKPSATAFHFPFVALPTSHRQRILWGKAPRAGIVTIDRMVAHRWTPVLRLHTTRGGIFYAKVPLGPHLTLRASLGGTDSLPWAVT